MKVCSKCGVEKPESEFNKQKGGKNGLSACCRICHNAYNKEWYDRNPELRRKKSKDWRENNPEQYQEYLKNWRIANPERCRMHSRKSARKNYKKTGNIRYRKWKAENPERVREYAKTWYRDNIEYVSECNKEYKKIRYASDLNFRLKHIISSQFSTALRGKKDFATLEFLEYSIEDLKAHLESTFKEGMSWENYGEWHIDHKRPQSWFDFTDKEQIKKCWALENLQALWATENFSKGNRYEG